MKILVQGLEKFKCPKMLITNPVRDAIQAAGEKLCDVIPDIQPIERITLYSGDLEVFKHYKITNEGNEVNGEVTVYLGVNIPDLTYYFKYKKQEKIWEMHGRKDQKYPEIQHFAHWCLFEELFLQFAHIETKILPPSRQIWDGPICKYNNKTKSDITIVDSTWFTTLIKSDGFKVRGHFRLQPYKGGEKKLIWIQDFKKHGYTRKARIESQQIKKASTCDEGPAVES
jgi:hypothetical protein